MIKVNPPATLAQQAVFRISLLFLLSFTPLQPTIAECSVGSLCNVHGKMNVQMTGFGAAVSIETIDGICYAVGFPKSLSASVALQVLNDEKATIFGTGVVNHPNNLWFEVDGFRVVNGLCRGPVALLAERSVATTDR